MNLGDVQTALTAWIESTSGLQCEWGRMPSKIRVNPYVLAYAGPISVQGHDERTYEYNEITDVMDEKMLGVRQLVVRLSFRSNDQRLGYSARQYAENFRLLTQSSTSIATLTAAYLGLVRTEALVETDYEWSGRMVSQVDMDVVLAFRADVSNADFDGATIQHANINSASYILDEAGEAVVTEDGEYVSDEEDDTIVVTTP